MSGAHLDKKTWRLFNSVEQHFSFVVLSGKIQCTLVNRLVFCLMLTLITPVPPPPRDLPSWLPPSLLYVLAPRAFGVLFPL